MPRPHAIEFRDVYKAFDHPVLTGVSLSVETGERLAIVGTSGTGKSVLLKTTIGLIEPDRGEVFIDGESVLAASRAHLERIRHKVGYVFQSAALFDSMTVYENVSLGLSDATLRELAPRQSVRRVADALREVNLDPAEVLAKLPAELSGGMRKRVGLARALIGRPSIILYDEPVTGLDPVNSAAVARLINEIAARSQVTSLLVTHDVEGAMHISDRIALLDQGRMRFVGTPAAFRQSPDPLVRAFADREAAEALVSEVP
jgi:phospholipid/cholesterol/gamma-HCH transport system ATP-binding protein